MALGWILALASGAEAQAVLPPDLRLDYLPLDFGTASTFLTGIRGTNIVGNSVIPGGQTGGLYYDSASGDWSAFPVATENGSNYPGAIGSSPYGPSFGTPGGVLRVVGSYKTDAAPVDLGYLYDGAAAPGSDPLTLVYPDPDTGFTIAHSTFGDTVVGNYDTGPLTGNAFIYDIPSGTYVTNNRRGAVSTTAYGVWGDKIAGGYGALGPDREPGFEHGYIYDMRTGRWTTHDHPDAVFTHFEGITGAGRGGAYNLVADWIGDDGKLQAAVLHIDAEGRETWIPIAFPGADVTTANSIHQDRVIGVYTDAAGTHGFEVTIPGIYDPIANRGELSSSADDVTLLEGAPGDDVVNSGSIVTTGDFANAVRVDRHGVVYNSGTIEVSGATAGAVALRGEFPSLINTGVLKGASAGDAVRADANASGSLIVNAGVIDGRIDVRAGDNARFENSGLIGMSEPGAGLSSVVSGVFVQTAAGAYAPRVGGAAADSLAVLGTARLSGALNPAVQPGALTRDYTLLTATGELTGRFDTFAPTGLPSFVTASVAYSDNRVDLALAAEIAGTAGLTRNEKGVARSLDDAFNSSPEGVPDDLNAAIFSLSPAGLPGALDALSGEVYASAQGALIDGAVFSREAVLGRLRQEVVGVGGPFPGAGAMAFAPMDSPTTGRGVTLWGQALGARIDADGDAGASGSRTDFTGVFGGADMRVGAQGVVGFAAGYTWSDTDVDGGGGTADADSLLVALYGGANAGPWSLRGGLSYAMSSIDAARDADFAGFSQSLDASYDATTAQVFGEVGYAIERGPVAIEPFLGLAWVHLDADGFTETGGEAALSGEDETSTVGYSTLGFRAGRSFETGLGTAGGSGAARAMTFTPHLSLAWRHAWGDLSTSASLSFAEMTAQGFVVSGVTLAEDTGIVDLGFDLAINPQATLGLAYLGQFSNGADTNALRATLAWAF